MALHNTGVNGGRWGADLHLKQAWETTTGTPATVIAVLDSGIDFTHPDLRANRWLKPADQVHLPHDVPQTLADEGTQGWDFVRDTPAHDDEAGHGTAVAGLIAAEGNNQRGISGVLWRASLMDVRMLDSTGTGDVAAAVEAVDYATAHGAQVLNLSWSTDYPSRALAEALMRAGQRGILAVCAAGNQGRDLIRTPRYPAAWTLSNVLAVTATDEYDRLAPWANFGGTGLIAAPGVNLLTTKAGGDYQSVVGTSGAAALVSGVAGLLRTVRPYLSAEQTKALLQQGVRHTDGTEIGLAQATSALSGLVSLPADEGLTNPRNLNGGTHPPTSAPVAASAAPSLSNSPSLHGETGPPRPGLPNLNVLRDAQPHLRSLPEIATPASVHPRQAGTPRNGLRVGEPLPLPTPLTSPTPLPTPSPQSTPLVTPTPGVIPGITQASAPTTFQLSALTSWQAEFTRATQPTHGPQSTLEADGEAPTLAASLGLSAAEVPPLSAASTRTEPPGQLTLETWYQEFYERVSACSWANNTCPSTSTAEQTYWLDILRKAYPAAESRRLAARDVGRTLFDSARYRARNRSDSEYVEDLYRAYLRRAPDGTPNDPNTGWGFWTSVAAPNSYGREAVRQAFAECEEFLTIINSLFSDTEPGANVTNVWSAKQDLLNSTGVSGVNPVSRNFGWSLPLVSLPGRAGLNLGLALSYNSLLWTQNGPYSYFDDENSFPAPGFRLGFPTIQGRYYNAEIGQNAYLLLTPDGSRVELRHIGGSGYESADSSYLRLQDGGNALLLYGTDGTQMSFAKINDEWRCTQIKDRNGNYLTVTYKWWGQIDTITDTLGRIVTFQYYNDQTNHSLYRIKQTWNGAVHIYAQFEYQATTLTPSGLTGLVVGTGGPTSSSLAWPLLSKVTLADGAEYQFSYYAATGQLHTVSHSPWNPYSELPELMNVTTLGLDDATGQTDRVSTISVWASSWMPQPVSTSYTAPVGVGNTNPYGTQSGTKLKVRTTLPDNTKQDTYFFAEGWWRGLVSYTETYETLPSGGEALRRWNSNTWTQDNVGLGYRLNPRPLENRVGDPQGNQRRLSVKYTSYGLPSDITEHTFDAPIGGVDYVLRRTHIDYRLEEAYLNRRIIGLPAARYLYEGGLINSAGVYSYSTLLAKTVYDYDSLATEYLQDTAGPTIQHDRTPMTGYGPDLVIGRGNLTSIQQFDVDNLNNSTTSQIGYYTTGTVHFTRDPLSHKTTFDYTDNFSVTANNGNKFAYPTKVTDPDDFFSTAQYNYDFGGVTRTEGPPPADNPNGAIQNILYDAVGRVARVTTQNTGAYTRYLYASNHIATWSTLKNNTEAFSVSLFDGLGQVHLTGTDHPGSLGGSKAQYTEYDSMGRVKRVSNPIEVTNGWLPWGEDQTGGWLYQSQTYDWKGRPLVSTNVDNTQTIASYAGCGCAGGEVVTLLGENLAAPTELEKRRKQKIYHDRFGRVVKVENYNWPAPYGDGAVYAATVTEYNARDQVQFVYQYDGPIGLGTSQHTEIQYDGYGRESKVHTPEMAYETWKTFSYDADHRLLSATDARGASVTYGYNNRHLVTGLTYDTPKSSDIPATPSVSFAYDAAGNRTQMNDRAGSVTYGYDSLSRLTSETRQFNVSLPNAPLTGNKFKIQYSYGLANQLTSLTDPFGATVDYQYDHTGRLTEVTGDFAGVTRYAGNATYRAWGALKQLSYGNTNSSSGMSLTYDSRLRATGYNLTGPQGAIMQKNYQYYADGQLRYVQDVLEPRFDRLNIYDQIGRIKEAKSGAEARGQTVTGNLADNLPYRQSYMFNGFNNLTGRNNLHWGRDAWYGENFNVGYQFANNRVTNYGWQYDADGRNVVSSYPEATATSLYDAAGRLVRSLQSEKEINRAADGNGHEIKRLERNCVTTNPEYPCQWQTEAPRYYLRSSVLGQAVVSEVNSTGKKLKTYVRAAGTVLAWQVLSYWGNGTSTESLRFTHNDAAGMSLRTTGSTGAVVANEGTDDSPAELDGIGNNVGTANPYIEFIPPPGGEGCLGCDNTGILSLESDSPTYINGQRVTCQLDGMAIGCNRARELLDFGAAIPATLESWQGVPGFSFEPVGLGLFRTTLPDIYVTWRDGRVNNVAAVPHGSRFDGEQVFAGGTFVTSWNPQHWQLDLSYFSTKKVGGAEYIEIKGVEGGRKILEKLLQNEKCKGAISKLLKEIGKLGELVRSDILELYDEVSSFNSDDHELTGVHFNLRQEESLRLIQKFYPNAPLTAGGGGEAIRFKISGDFKPFLSVFPTPYIASHGQNSTYKLALALVHELFHVAKKGDSNFTHEQFEEAAKALGATDGFQGYLRDNCDPTINKDLQK